MIQSKVILRVVASIALIAVIAPTSAMAVQAKVSVITPERISGVFNITIEVAGVRAMDSGQFDFHFDPNVLQVIDVKSGEIAGTMVPVSQWAPLDEQAIRVLFNFPGVQGVTGSGFLAIIGARVTGRAGDMTVLRLSKGLLVDDEAKKIPAMWLGGAVTVETSAPEPAPVPVRQADQISESEEANDGISISTPFAVGVLAFLVVIPILYLLLVRRT